MIKMTKRKINIAKKIKIEVTASILNDKNVMMKGKMVNRVYISSEKDTKNIKDRK